MNIFLKWQNNKNSKGKYLIFLVIGALIFPILVPTVLVILLPQVDKIIGIASFYNGLINIIVGIIAIILGGFIIGLVSNNVIVVISLPDRAGI